MAYGYNLDPVGGAINTGLNVFSAINGYYDQQRQGARQDRLDAQAAEDRARRMEREDFQFDELKAAKAREEAGRELAPVKLWLQQQKALPPEQRQVMPPEFLEKLRQYDPSADNYLKNPLAIARAQQTLLDPELVKQAGSGVAEAEETLKNALTTYLGPRLGGGRVVKLQALPGGKIAAEGEFPSIPARTRDGKPAVDEQGNQLYLTRGGQPTPGPTYIAPLTMGGDPGPEAQVAMPTVQQLYAKLMDEHDTLNILNNAIAAHDPKYYEQLMAEAKTAEERRYTEGREGVKHGQAIDLKKMEIEGQDRRNKEDNETSRSNAKLSADTTLKATAIREAGEQGRHRDTNARQDKREVIALRTENAKYRKALLSGSRTDYKYDPITQQNVPYTRQLNAQEVEEVKQQIATNEALIADLSGRPAPKQAVPVAASKASKPSGVDLSRFDK